MFAPPPATPLPPPPDDEPARRPALAALPPAPTLTPAVRASRALAVGGLLALIALCLAWELWLAPLRPGGSSWALKALPLTLPLAGLLKYRMYTYRWLSLMLWLYVTEGLVRATSERGLSAWLAAAEVALSLIVFTACSWHVRTRLKAAAAHRVFHSP